MAPFQVKSPPLNRRVVMEEVMFFSMQHISDKFNISINEIAS